MSKDFAEGLYEGSNENEIARNDHGGLRVMAVLAPCRTSRELEAHAARLVATSDVEIVFVNEAGNEELHPLTPVERAELRKQFTDEQIEEFERMMT